MASPGPRHLVHGVSTRLVRASRPARTPARAAPPPTASRAVHRVAPAPSAAAAHTSSAAARTARRDAHALATRVKYGDAPPPPPPPAPPPPKGSSSLSDAEPSPSSSSSSRVEDWPAPLAVDGENALHPKWDERGLTGYASEPVLPEALAGGGLEGETIGAERGGAAWESEEEWVELLRRGAEEEAAREEEREVREARPTPAQVERVEEVQVAPPPPVTTPSAPPLPAVEPSAPRPSPFAVPRTPTPRRRALPLRLEPVPRADPALIAPYLPHISLSPTSSSPAAQPLLSRHDWRLSSPLRRFVRSSPPPLFSRAETDTRALGHNKLLGVGVDAARIGKHALVRGEEQWGWKVRVPETERGKWDDADAYRARLDRLLTLSQKADETLYLASLARQGPPAERELKGVTLCRALGAWLTGDASRAEEMAQLDPAEREKRRMEGAGAAAGGQARAVACFEAEDGRALTEDKGWKFAPGTILRFTLAAAHDPSAHASGPQPPPAAEAAASSGKWFVQGTLLEVREEQLVVAFDEVDMWPLGEEAYQIDLGLDTTSYALQSAAIDNLYLDPARQRAHNATQVAAVQHAFVGSGALPSLREWAIQGTELREALVPRSETAIKEKEESTMRSDLLRGNQLINSWIERYQRDDPLELPGDPDLGLNASQTKAIAMALGEKLSLIQGPPGTGKSQTLVSLIALLKLHFRIPSPILLSAPTHVSVDHLVLLLVRAGLNPLRCGKAAKVAPEVQPWTIERRQEQHPLWERLEKAREESEGFRLELQEWRDARREMANDGGKAADEKDLELEGKYRKAWRRYIMLEHKLYSSLLATADVFCATALGSGASKVLNMVDFPIVLLDEAAMCTEPVSLIPLMKGAQHATLIGDHKQLPAVVTSQEAKDERLHLSLFERLLTSEKVKSTLLDTQYRMRPSISSFPNQSFYAGALRDAPAVSTRPPPLQSRYFGGVPPSSLSTPSASSAAPPTSDAASAPHEPVAFVTHSGPETVHRQSLLNRTESSILISIVGDLLLQNPSLRASDIGIISPYYAQTRLLLNTFESGYAASRLRPLLGAQRAAEAGEVEVNTVDGFQGREKRVVLLSTVRSNQGGYIGFLTDRRRLNVALTRARDALIVVGNERTLRKAAFNAAGGGAGGFEVGRGGAYDEDDYGAAPAEKKGERRDPDADPAVWRKFLDWCARRGLVRRWEEPEPVAATAGSRRS
ncbi:hypothetical protein JCM10450v2_000006 [Rhodotorula kratochvilovae]